MRRTLGTFSFLSPQSRLHDPKIHLAAVLTDARDNRSHQQTSPGFSCGSFRFANFAKINRWCWGLDVPLLRCRPVTNRLSFSSSALRRARWAVHVRAPDGGLSMPVSIVPALGRQGGLGAGPGPSPYLTDPHRRLGMGSAAL